MMFFKLVPDRITLCGEGQKAPVGYKLWERPSSSLTRTQTPAGAWGSLDDVFLRPGAQVADLYVRQAPKTIELDLSAALVYDIGATDERMEFIWRLTAFAIFPQIRITADLTICNPVMLDNRPVDEWAIGLTRQEEQEQRAVDDADKLP